MWLLLVFGTPNADSKPFRGEAAGRIFSRMAVDGWGFDIEVLALSLAMPYKVGISAQILFGIPGV
jgi:hypothetical protein